MALAALQNLEEVGDCELSDFHEKKKKPNCDISLKGSGMLIKMNVLCSLVSLNYDCFVHSNRHESK